MTHPTYSFRHHARQPANWKATQRWVARKDYWEWDSQLNHLRGKEREMRVELVLPHPVYPGAMESGHSNPGQDKLEGNMAYTIPMIPEKRIRDWSQKMYLRWNELFYNRNFGDYFPDEPFPADHFKTAEHPEWSADGLTYDDINRYIDMCHRHGVKAMPYFNLSECESGIARRCFPESIAKFSHHEEMVPWIYYDRRNHSVVMNGDPQYPWFECLMPQFEKLLQRCPGIDGFFFDQMCYGWIDMAHDDGVTYCRNQPAYNMGNMYLRSLKGELPHGAR